jgi:hypothetical protein
MASVAANNGEKNPWHPCVWTCSVRHTDQRYCAVPVLSRRLLDSHRILLKLIGNPLFISINEYREIFGLTLYSGPGSSDGIVTGHVLGGQGIESRLGRDFLHLSRQVLGPTQPRV